MTELTTMKVSKATRDELKSIADREGVSLDAALRQLLRSERQRMMGADLAARPVSEEMTAWIAATNAAVVRALG
jgi:hypothetical protein